MPTTITATRYNNLRGRLDAIMGTPHTTQGYGETLASDDVLPTTNKITDEQYRDLYTDMLRARVHQIGQSALTINPFVVGDYDTNLADTDKVTEAYIAGLETLMSDIEADKDLIDIADQASVQGLQTSLGTAVESVRTYPPGWNGTINFIYQVIFDSNADAYAFFNAGGEIRNSAVLSYTGAQAKTVNWQSILDEMGTINMGATRTYSSNAVGSGTSIGYRTLTSTYKTLYRKYGDSVYNPNNYHVQALKTADNIIQFKIEFNDPPYGNPDESILGDLTATADIAFSDGSLTIGSQILDSIVTDNLPEGQIISNL